MIVIIQILIMNNLQAGFTPSQVAKRKFLLLGFSSCALALSCVSFSAAVGLTFYCLIVCLSVCLYFAKCSCVCDFDLFSLSLWKSMQVRSSEALLIVYVFSVGLFAVTQVLMMMWWWWWWRSPWRALEAMALTISLMIMSATCRPLLCYWPTQAPWSTPWWWKSTPSCN